MKYFSTKLLFSVIALIAVTACGGGGGSGSAPGPTPPVSGIPDSAKNTSIGAFSFANMVAATSLDSVEPILVLDADQLASSETDEPEIV